jgi:hypothetical protein
MKIDGSCHCGEIRFCAEVDPTKVSICHCADCQTFSSSAFRVAVKAKTGTFELLAGEPKVYVKTADSGNKRAQGFCATCGTSIYSTVPGDGPKVYTLRSGTIRQRAELAPSLQIWTRSAVTWLDHLPEIESIVTQPVFDAAGRPVR